jgi:hypothetical protein
MANVYWILAIQEKVIDELLPDMFILGESFQEGQRLELPSIALTLAFAVAHPSPRHDSTPSRLHLALLDEVYPSNC